MKAAVEAGAADLALSPAQTARLDGLAEKVAGARYHETGMATLDG